MRRLAIILLLTVFGTQFGIAAEREYTYLYRTYKTGPAPKAVIMISGDAAREVEIAAQILQSELKKVTKVKFPIIRDSLQERFGTGIFTIVISVGDTLYTLPESRKVIAKEKGTPNAFLIDKATQNMQLLGNTPKGTLFAVYDFMRSMGDDWPQSEKVLSKQAGTYKLDVRKPRKTKRISTVFLKMGRVVVKPEKELTKEFDAINAILSKEVLSPKLEIAGAQNAPVAIRMPILPTAKEEMAAKFLADNLKNIYGTAMPVFRGDVKNAKKFKYVISVGRTVDLPAALKSKLAIGRKYTAMDRENDAFGIEIDGKSIFLVGHRDEGTFYAVVDFLESLGCRWFYGSEAGIIIPKLNPANLAFKIKSKVSTPDIALRYQFTWYTTKRTKEDKRQASTWLERNKLSELMPRGFSGHNLDRVVPPKLYDTHPEYFPLIKGKRHRPKGQNNWQPCFSNPSVIDLAVAWAEEKLSKHPELDAVSFVPNDGGGYCQCANCLKIGNCSDQMLNFVNEIGKRIFKDHPGKKILIYGYYETSVNPKLKAIGYDDKKDRIIVSCYANSTKVPFKQSVEGWTKSSHHVIPSIIWGWRNWHRGIAANPANLTASLESLKYFSSLGCSGIRLQAMDNWTKNGIERYIAAKMMWNLNVDIDAIRADFYQKMFPSDPEDFAAFQGLYARAATRKIPLTCFIRDSLFFLKRLEKRIKSPEERHRWECFVLYIHEQILELKLKKAITSDDRIKRWSDMAAFLKGIEKYHILEARILMTNCWNNLADIYKRLGKKDEMPFSNYMLDTIPAMKVDSKVIKELMKQDMELYPPATATVIKE